MEGRWGEMRGGGCPGGNDCSGEGEGLVLGEMLREQGLWN